MKKWALPVSLAVAVAASSATAFAATDPIVTNFRGHFKSALQYNSSDVNKDIVNGTHDPANGDHHLPTGAFGAVDVDLRGDIILSPNANNRFVLELRQRIRGDKLMDQFPTRFSSAFGASSNTAAFGGDVTSGSRFQPETGKLVDKAYLENKSAWWEGGPTITSRIGRQDPNWNPWIAKFSRFDRNGVTIQGFKLGPADINLGYIWGGEHVLNRVEILSTGDVPAADPAKTKGIQSLVVNAKLPVEVANLELTAVRTSASSGLGKAIIDYAAGLSVPIAADTSLSGVYARDALNEKNAYNVKIGTKLGGANLSAMYRSVDKGYAPIYEDREDLMNPERRTQSKVHDERTGFKIAADGQVHNWNLRGSFDSSHRSWLGRSKDEKIDTVELGASTKFQAVDFWASATLEKSKETGESYVEEYYRPSGNIVLYREGPKNDKNTYVVGLGTNFDIVRAEYQFKHVDEKTKNEKTDHTISLKAPISVAYLDTLHVGASVSLRDSHRKTGYGVDLAWQGKNGLRAGIHYTGGYNGELKNRQWNDTNSGAVVMRTADPDELRKYVYPDGTTHYLGNGLAVTAGWGIDF